MGFYFSRVVDEVGRALMAGANVRLTGVQGSGRSAVMDRLAERLGRLGHTVHRGGGGQLPRRMSGQLIAQLGIPWPPAGSSAATGVDAAVDRLCAAWSAEGHPVLLLDDAHEVDAVSAGILARAVRRMGVPVVRAVRHGAADPEDLDRPVSDAAEVGVAMPAMTADDVVEMAAQLLGAPPEPMLASRVLAKSGGIPGLSASIITTARVAGHIELAFGQWRVVSDSLWNQHLAPVIDARLQGLPRAEREALAVIALRGAAAPAELIAAHPAEALVGLERRGLLAEAAEGGARRIHVWPPILADRYQRGLSTLARMALTGDAAGDLPAGPDLPGEPPADLPERRAVMLARRMQDAARRRAAQRYARWAERPTEARSVRYLDAAFGSAGESARFREVLAWLEDLGPTFSAGYVELLRQALRAAGGQEGTRAVAGGAAAAGSSGGPGVDEAGGGPRSGEAAGGPRSGEAGGTPSGAEPFPDPRSLVEALAVIADDDLESPPEDSDPDRCVIRAIVTGRIDAARDLSERLGASRLSAALRCHVLYLDGHIDEAILRLRALLEEASADADRDTFLIASHGLALIERHWGDPAASHSILSAALSVGQPGVVSATFFGAMLHWAAVDAHDRGRYALRDSLWRDGSSYAPGVGPLYGMGGDLVRAMVEEDPERFDRAVAEVIRARVERGYVIAALHTGVGALQRHAGPELFAAIAGIPAPRGSSPLSFLQPLAGALEAGRADEAGRILAALPAGFAPTSARMVAAAMRWWRGRGEDRRAEELARLLGPSRDAAEEAVTGLSRREAEVGMLAGMLTNAEIAQRLGLSTRTVENHVANALKKTGLAGREELARRLMRAEHPFR